MIGKAPGAFKFGLLGVNTGLKLLSPAAPAPAVNSTTVYPIVFKIAIARSVWT